MSRAGSLSALLVLGLALSGCKGEICDPAKLEVHVRVDDVAVVSAAHRLEVWVTRGSSTQPTGFDVQPDVLDGVLDREIPLVPPLGTQETLRVDVRILDRAAGNVLRLGSISPSTSGSCATRAAFDLTMPSLPPPVDGGAPADGGDRGDAGVEEIDAGGPSAALRRRLLVETGSVTPELGWPGYTVRVSGLDTAEWIGRRLLSADCRELRVRAGSLELPRHLIGCGSRDAELRFMLPRIDPAPELWLEYGPAASALPPVMTSTNVYLYYDDASVDRSAALLRGRLDNWYTGYVDALRFVDQSYSYDTTDDSMASYRFGLSERDVYVEAELNHRACYPTNMVTGLVARASVPAAEPAAEVSDRYYAGTRRAQAGCTPYPSDLSIVRGSRDGLVVSYEGPPPANVEPGRWRKQGLAVFGGTETHLAYWDEDTPWPSPGWPSAPPKSSGTDPDGILRPGDVGIVTAQDSGSLRNILVRRFVLPEPKVSVGAEEPRP